MQMLKHGDAATYIACSLYVNHQSLQYNICWKEGYLIEDDRQRGVHGESSSQKEPQPYGVP